VRASRYLDRYLIGCDLRLVGRCLLLPLQGLRLTTKLFRADLGALTVQPVHGLLYILRQGLRVLIARFQVRVVPVRKVVNGPKFSKIVLAKVYRVPELVLHLGQIRVQALGRVTKRRKSVGARLDLRENRAYKN
jgi:hypothetical protein